MAGNTCMVIFENLGRFIICGFSNQTAKPFAGVGKSDLYKDPTSSIKALEYGLLREKNHIDHKQTLPYKTLYNVSQPSNDEFSLHLSDDERINHAECIDTGNSEWKLQRNFNGKDVYVRVLSPVNCAEIQAVEKERKAKNILLMAIPKEHMRRFHGMDDAKEIWEAIRTRFGAHGAEVSTEVADHNVLRSFPLASVQSGKGQ
ncbi:hypothetical protein Tco_0206562 [Tanacetum coccineum]